MASDRFYSDPIVPQRRLLQEVYFLQSFHSLHPGVTSQIFAQTRIGRGKSSYELLVDTLPDDGAPLKVVDLGCGDGFLLELLGKRHSKKLHLIGVDMSEAELHAARGRLASFEVTLLCEKAHNVSLSDSSVDYRICYLCNLPRVSQIRLRWAFVAALFNLPINLRAKVESNIKVLSDRS